MGKRRLAEWYPQDAIQIFYPHAGTDRLRLLADIEFFHVQCTYRDDEHHRELTQMETADFKTARWTHPRYEMLERLSSGPLSDVLLCHGRASKKTIPLLVM